MFVWFFVCLFCLLGAKEGVILSIDKKEYSHQQFFSHYPKKQWENADSTKRDKIYTDFIKRQLCILEAKKLGLESDPVVAVKIRDRSNQLLVNESYEQLVAFPLINPEDIADARIFARDELLLNHILIGYSGAYLPKPPERSIDDALILTQNLYKQFIDGEKFSFLAKNFSDDPSASLNSGSLGWVRWGETVPAFQSAAFRLDLGKLSTPILTDYGYHLILAEDRRPSDYQYMSDEEYEAAIIGLSKRTIRNKLRAAALSYDSLQIEALGVYFNYDAILKIAQTYNQVLKKGSENIDVIDVLASIANIGVVCVYERKGFGVLWFATRIMRIPSSGRPVLDSEYNIISVFKTIILQDVALKNGYKFDINNSFSFNQRKQNIISDILYDAYLKHVVNNISKPDTADVQEYYNNNEDKYSTPVSVLIREIRVASRSLADSILNLAGAGGDFEVLAKKYSLINSDTAGLVEPFFRKQNRSFFDAAMLLGPGKISPVLSSPGGLFSIILLEKKIAGKPLDFFQIYARIESVLIKEWQTSAKKAGVDGLLDKYSVLHSFDLLD